MLFSRVQSHRPRRSGRTAGTGPDGGVLRPAGHGNRSVRALRLPRAAVPVALVSLLLVLGPLAAGAADWLSIAVQLVRLLIGI